jgi:hypothetical protein
MENITLTKEQLYDFMKITNGIFDYQGTHDSPEEYEKFLKDTFGEDWSELMGEWDTLYEYEFDVPVYLYLTTGILTEDLKDWIEQGKELLFQILSELEDEEEE